MPTDGGDARLSCGGNEDCAASGRGPTPVWRQRVSSGALGLGFLALLLYPIVSTPYLPLVDLPKHLARVAILSDYQANPLFQQTFERSWTPIPNLALDLTLLPLLELLGPSLAMRAFMCGIALIFAVGCVQLQRAITGESSLLGIAASFFVYSSPLYFGFVNYVAGVAVFMIALAHWLRHSPSIRPGFLAASAGLAAVCYLAHLVAYAAFAAAIIWYSALALARGKDTLTRVAIRLVPLVLPLAAFVAFMWRDGSVGTLELNTVAGKIIGLFPWLIGYEYAWDALLAGLLVLGSLAVGTVRGPPRVVWEGVGLAAVFFLLFLATPKVLLTSSAADARWVLPGVLVLVLSIRDHAPDGGRGRSWHSALGSYAAVLLIFQAGRLAATVMVWHQLSARTEAQIRDLLPAIPAGSRILSVYEQSSSRQEEKRLRGMRNNPHYATVFRSALVSDPFAQRGAQPLILRDNALPRLRRGPAPARVAEGWPHYDYAWIHGAVDSAMVARVQPHCAEVTTASGVLLCRLKPLAGARAGAVPRQP